MASDFMLTAAVVDQVLAVLRGADGDDHTGGLPANWFAATRDALETPLRTLQHGDMRDMAVVDVRELLPAILVRGGGTQPRASGTGTDDCWEPITIVHARHFDDCYDDDGAPEENMTRARERYARLIHRAVFNDRNRKLATIDAEGARTEATLATDDQAAHVVDVQFMGWDLGENTDERVRAARIWTVELRIRARTLTTAGSE